MNRSPGCSQDVLRLAGSFIIAMAVLSPAARGQCVANELAKATAFDPQFDAEFGYSVAIDGDIAVIGAMREDTEQGGWSSGAAHVYRFDGAQWIEEATLISADIGEGNWFGRAVAVSGDTILVGANARSLFQASSAGAAYVFRFKGGEWVQEARLNASDFAAGDHFGSSVSIVGNIAAVGAPKCSLWFGCNPNGTTSAYVYRFDGSEWIEEAILTASDETEGAHFGCAVAVATADAGGAGDVVLVGAFNDDTVDDLFGLGQGAVYAYRFDPRTSQWNEEAKLTVPDPVANVAYRFGKEISLDGNLALIGSESTGDDGAYVFRFDPEGCQGDGCWVFEAKLVSSDLTFGDRFGTSVAIDGDLALVGAWGVWDPTISCWTDPPDADLCNAGAAYVFAFDGTEWVEQAKLISSDIDEFDALGWFVALSGETALVGAPGDQDAGYRTGAAYFFGALSDCNDNGAIDICDIADGDSDDDNNNGVLDECECPWDLDDDDVVGAPDLLFLLGAWGTDPGGPPDFNGDGNVGAADLIELLGNWGPCQ